MRFAHADPRLIFVSQLLSTMKKTSSILSLATALVVFAFGILSGSAQGIDAEFTNGVNFLQEGENQAAYETFDNIIRTHAGSADQIGPVFGSIYYHRGVAAMRKGDLAQAAADFTTCFEDFPNVADANARKNMYETMAMYQAAFCQRQTEAYADALKNFDKFEDRASQPNIVDKQNIKYNRAELKAHAAFCFASTGKPEAAAETLSEIYSDKGGRDPKTGSLFKIRPLLNEHALVLTLKAFLDGEKADKGTEFIGENRQHINREAGLRYQFARNIASIGAQANQAEEYEYALALLSIVPMTDESNEWLRRRKSSVEAVQSPGYAKMIEKIEARLKEDIAEGRPIEILVLETVGSIYEVNRNFEGSYAVFNLLVNDYPKSDRLPILLYRAANAAYVTGRVMECEKYGQDFLTNYPDHELRPNVEKMMIRGIFMNGQYESAIEIATRLRPSIADGSPGADVADYVLGASHYFLGHWQDALASLDKHIESFPESDFRESAMFYRADTESRLGNFKKSGIMLDDYLEKYPEGGLLDRALYSRATAHFYLDELSEAQTRLNEFFSKTPNSLVRDEAYNLFGNVLYSQENADVAAARKAYQRALDIAEEFSHTTVAAEALQSLMMVARDEKEYDLAVKLYDAYFEKYPDEFNRAKVATGGLKPLEEVGRLDDGLNRIEKLIAELGNERDAFGVDDLITAYSQSAIKGGMKLEELRENLMKIEGLSPDADVTRAMLLMAVIDAYEEAIKSEKNEGTVRQLTGTVDALYGQLERRFKPDRMSNYILYRLGDQLVQRKRGPEAEKYLNEILGRSDTSFRQDALFALASLKVALGGDKNNEEAVVILRDLIANNPNDNKLLERATGQLGEALMAGERWQEANETWREYLKHTSWLSRGIEATYNVGFSHEKMGQGGEAQKAYAQVIGTDPGFLKYSVPSWISTAEIFWAAGEKQKAYDTLHHMIKKVGHLEDEDPSGKIRDAKVKYDVWSGEPGILAKPL